MLFLLGMQWQINIYRDISWQDLEDEQRRCLALVEADKTQAFLLVSEPQPTFTYGRNSISSELLWSPEELNKKGVQTAAVSRGGKWTYHGPGQIVIYPIVALATLGYHSKAARAFVEDLREATGMALKEMGLERLSYGEPFGIYVEQKKLVSFGLAFHRGITSHGLALYYSDQTEFFKGITPCGVEGGMSSSLREHINTCTSWLDASTSMTKHIKNRFSLRGSQVL